MKDDSLAKLGGICSILVGVSYVLVGVTYLMQPADLQVGADPSLFWPTLAQNPTMNTLNHWAAALGAVLALAVVPAISQVVRPHSEGWVRWTSSLAFIGFAVTAIENFRVLAVYPTQVAAYVAGNASVQAAITASRPLIYLDPQAWLQFGAIGVWVLVVNLLAHRTGTWAKGLAYVGIASAILYWLVVAGSIPRPSCAGAPASSVTV